MSITDHIRQEVVRGLVQYRITCPHTGKILDAESCAVLLDRDGDPTDVIHQSIPPLLSDEDIAKLAAEGFTIRISPFIQADQPNPINKEQRP